MFNILPKFLQSEPGLPQIITGEFIRNLKEEEKKTPLMFWDENSDLFVIAL